MDWHKVKRQIRKVKHRQNIQQNMRLFMMLCSPDRWKPSIFNWSFWRTIRMEETLTFDRSRCLNHCESAKQPYPQSLSSSSLLPSDHLTNMKTLSQRLKAWIMLRYWDKFTRCQMLDFWVSAHAIKKSPFHPVYRPGTCYRGLRVEK